VALNTGNAAYEHVLSTLRYLRLPDGTCRTLNETVTGDQPTIGSRPRIRDGHRLIEVPAG
jgi:hypothetical protein